MTWRFYLSCVTGAAVGYQLLRITKKYVRWFTSPLHKLPGPKRSFLFGSFIEILRRPFMDAHFEWWAKAGKKDTDFIYYSQLFGSSSVLVLNADYIKRILVANYRQPQYQKKFMNLERLLGKGLVTLEGEDWHRHRRLIQPSFQVGFLKSGLDQHAPQRVARLLTSWKKIGHDQPIDIYSHFSMLTLDILGEIAFAHNFQGIPTIEEWAEGVSTTVSTGDKDITTTTTNNNNNNNSSDELPPASDRLIRALSSSMKSASKRILLSIFGLQALDFETVRMEKALSDAVADVIENARQRLEVRNQNATSSGKYTPKSILEALLDAKDSESEDGRERLQFNELQSEVKTFIMAGHETTSTWCYWATYCLCRYPEIQERLYEDISKHVLTTGDESDDDRISFDLATVEKMVYLDAFLKEVLRFYSPVGMIVRHTTQEEDYGGTLIPPHTRLVIPVHLLHRSPRYWKDPDVFQPERWLDDDATPYSNLYAYLPFSHGPRNCIGYRFATMEAKLIIAAIVRRVRFELIPELRDTDFKLTNYVIVKAKPAIKVNVKFREERGN